MDRETERLVWYILGATRGGPMRMRIMEKLINRPQNMNSLARELDVNYRTVEHHINILIKSEMVVGEGEGYGKIYFPSAMVEKIYDEIVAMMKRRGMNV